MKYLILIYSNPMSRELWARFSPAEQAAGFQYYAVLTDDLAASRGLVAAKALTDITTTKRVHVRAGQTLTTDGPFAEAKQHLMGVYLVQCESPARPVAFAARIPEAARGLTPRCPAKKERKALYDSCTTNTIERRTAERAGADRT